MAQALEQVCRNTGLGDPSHIPFDATFKHKSLGVRLQPVEKEMIADMGHVLLMAGVKSSEEVPESKK
jgi:hypothetical protein